MPTETPAKPITKKDVYHSMLELVNQIHTIKNQTNEPETAILVEHMFRPLSVVLDHLESCPHGRRTIGDKPNGR